MAFKLGPLNLNAVAQGVGGLVFGNQSADEADGEVERLLERVSNGVLADDRRPALQELRDVILESPGAQLAFGAMGFPVLMEVLQDEREDLEMVRGALEVLISGLAVPAGSVQDGQVVPGLVNSELFAREPSSVPLLLGLLEEDDFYVRYHTVQLLTILLTNCSHRLQEAILQTPQGVARLMDMLQEREVIRNEALLLMINLTRSAEEIQKIVVFEGAFERIFNTIKEEGAADGGIVVQDSIELLNNLLRNNPSNQVFLRETMGLSHVPALLKMRKGDAGSVSRQKAANLLCALETVSLLLARNAQAEVGKDSHLAANQTALAQADLLEALLVVALEGTVSSSAVRAQALRAIGDLVSGHVANRERLGSAMVGEEGKQEPALHCILRSALKATTARVASAADSVFQSFCEGNLEGQSLLASTITPLPQSTNRGSRGVTGDDTGDVSFGSMLVRALLGMDGQQDLEVSCRAASVLAHVLKGNSACKERVLKIPLEIPSSALAPPELLMPRCMRYLAAAGQANNSSNSSLTHVLPGGTQWLQPVLLRLLVTWLYDCPPAVSAFLTAPAHLPFLLETASKPGAGAAGVHVAGLSAVLLGACVVFNPATSLGGVDAATVVDTISQRVGLTAFFSWWEDMKHSALFMAAAVPTRLARPLTRTSAAAAAAASDDAPSPAKHMAGPAEAEPESSGSMADGHLPPRVSEPEVDLGIATFYDTEFVRLVGEFEDRVRTTIVKVFAQPRGKALPGMEGEEALHAAAEQREGESDGAWGARLKGTLLDMARELKDLRERNGALAEDLLCSSGVAGENAKEAHSSRGRAWGESSEAGRRRLHSRDALASKAEMEALRIELAEAQQAAKVAAEEKLAAESEADHYRQLAAKHEANLQDLSDAYNSLEQDNFRLETQLRTATAVSQSAPADAPELSEEKLEIARQEGRDESSVELDDLLECLGQEEIKVKRLYDRLLELNEDPEALLEGIGDEDMGASGGEEVESESEGVDNDAVKQK